MGVADHLILDLIQKVRSLIFCPLASVSESLMPGGVRGGSSDRLMCYDCRAGLGGSVCGHRCRSCGRVFCWKCMQSGGSSGLSGEPVEELPKYCKFCFQVISGHRDVAVKRRGEKVSPLVSPEFVPKSPLSGSGSNIKPGGPPELQQFSSTQMLRCSTSRSDVEEVVDEAGKQFLSPLSEFSPDVSDIDAISTGSGNEICGFKSITSSPLDSPSRTVEKGDVSPMSRKIGLFDQDSLGYLRKPGGESEVFLEHGSDCTYDNLSVYQNQESQKAQQPLDFANNLRIWCPPPPEDEGDDMETGVFECDDDDDEVGDSGKLFSSCSFSSDVFRIKEKSNEVQKELLRNAVRGHFRALISQLLKGEGVHVGNENGGEGWLEVVSSLAWQAANFVKPDTSKGGSMDPGNYVKVKCIASGRPMDSTLIKGVVCTKNIKHKRMVSQHRNPRLLLLGGALEYQKVPNKLASINTVLEQEIDHLKMAVGKIELHRPNVLLVEKSVSSYAQEYLLAKEISLVLNVKRPLLERISRCTGAQIVPSIDNVASARLGYCEMFRVEKVSEEGSSANHPNKKSVKTLMFFEGCPRRLGCTVLLRGTSRDELKKVKHVVQFASFAAYHLSLETSFLADEGATLPKIPLKPPLTMRQKLVNADTFVSTASTLGFSDMCQTSRDKYQGVGLGSKLETECLSSSSNVLSLKMDGVKIRFEQKQCKSSSDCMNSGSFLGLSSTYSQNYRDFIVGSTPDTSTYGFGGSVSPFHFKEPGCSSYFPTDIGIHQGGILEKSGIERSNLANDKNLKSVDEHRRTDLDDGDEVPIDYLSTAENHQSILVSLSSTCVLKGTVCERSQLFRIKFYGSFDKPLGRYLHDDLFDQTSYCHICKEPAEAHVQCYTHQQGSLTISVRRLPEIKLPGERDGRIWMWHRCLKCELQDGVPPAAHRVVMSDAAWGLSFGKFLELSFSNHATANRIASCGHSLQKDCLRFYGFGSMVAFFRYSPVDILSVNLPPSTLDFTSRIQQELVRKEAAKISNKVEFLHAEVSKVLQGIEKKITNSEHEPLKASIPKHITVLRELLKRGKNEYEVLLQTVKIENIQLFNATIDILELNRLRRNLLLDAYLWDYLLYLLDSLSKAESYTAKFDPKLPEIFSPTKLKDWRDELFSKDWQLRTSSEKNIAKTSTLLGTPRKSMLSKQQEEISLQVLESNSSNMVELNLSIESTEGYVGPAGLNLASGHCRGYDERNVVAEASIDTLSLEDLPSPVSSLSDQIDLAWTGSGQLVMDPPKDGPEDDSVGSSSLMDSPCYKKVMSPVRVYSFDSALKFRDRVHGGLSPSLHLTSFKSFDASGDSVSMFRDPLNIRRAYSQRSPRDIQRWDILLGRTPIYISSVSHMVSDGARLLLPQTGLIDGVIAVYDDEPTSIISYAMTSREYAEFIASKLNQHVDLNGKEQTSGMWNQTGCHAEAKNFAAQESVAQYQSNDTQSRCYGSDGTQLSQENPSDPKESHFRISFDDESSFPSDKVKYSVTCYFGRQFDALRKKCCPNELDYIRSLSRCKKWSAQGGKSNVYFAKSLDERFIIKQVTKTELDSFEDFAPEYFKYLTESITSGSPTCLAKILGIYQVTVKHLKGGREIKMDLMVMENLFFRRNISRVYDLKGSLRSRYNPDASGDNRVLLDLNLLETLRTKPIFLGSKAKRSLERAVWNDTSFLASGDVMDYSLLVGIDEDRKELVIGIIDFMRQYTWDKQLETWVKASGILGGPKDASPTIIYPMQYKKRFRKAMSKYFLTVPDQWSS
ncbi:putative 1-phosphatidylinositol-3-phosphate 5-kinase FAB1C [Phoenix dactylifera]|uniref:1-phosphatidylinositol-3-phosphate 5-kinase n=1 Tax=Phoenix dactylifera TaxID=42345 RepID=A0A8B7CL09_PHODC|nr:putative 1-phosphatidylinositol-3-phosphate 5-kinase FAB1C [Phoenix dactylifera]XP_008801163.2 putative 1-phosphatidylinositol-3-phosphate 5-kinase FAB1C [Phoenix dactylifera]